MVTTEKKTYTSNPVRHLLYIENRKLSKKQMSYSHSKLFTQMWTSHQVGVNTMGMLNFG